MLQDDSTALFRSKQVYAQEVQSEPKMSRKKKQYQIGTKLSQSFIRCI